MNKLISAALVLLLVLGGAYFFTQNEGGSSPLPSLPGGGGDQLAISDTLIERLPKSTLSFVYWNAEHPAYKSLVSSPWGQTGSALDSLPTELPIFKTLKAGGIDVSDKESIASLLEEAVFFITPPTESAEMPVSLGALVKSQDAAKVASFHTAGIQALKEEEEIKVEEMQIGSHKGYKIDSTVKSSSGKEAPLTVYAAYSEEFSVWASDEATAAAVLDGKNTGAPDILESPKFKSATSDMYSKDSTFSFGYVGISELVKTMAALSDEAAALNSSAMETVAFAASMDQAPVTDLKALYNTNGAPEFLKSVKNSSPAALAKTVTGSPLLFLTLDGSILKAGKQAAAATPAAAMLQGMEALDSISRLGLSIGVAPLGQSLLPIPDFSIVLETDKGAEVTEIAKQLLQSGAAMASQGLPQGPSNWVDKEILGRKVSTRMLTLGVNVAVATDTKYVLISNSEQNLESSLKGLDGDAAPFAETSPKKVKADITQYDSLGLVYFDFEQLAALIKNLEGLLAMFGAQSPEIQQALSSENVEKIKKMGVMNVTLRHQPEKGEFRLVNYYEKTK